MKALNELPFLIPWTMDNFYAIEIGIWADTNTGSGMAIPSWL